MTGCDIKQGNCLDILPALEANSVDSIVTDPPYGLNFMGKDWDHGVPGVQFWVEALRVAKPGAHLLAFGGTRTFHRLTCAIEDAGWEIRDCLGWLYGSGFPKSHNLKGEWEGFGTALKPAWEPIILARKPIKGTVVDNVLRYGTGAMNIDGCRVPVDPAMDDMLRVVDRGKRESETWENGSGFKNEKNHLTGVPSNGRWPANIIHDGSDEVLGLFPITSSTKPHSGNGNKLDTREQGWGFKRMPCSLSDNGGSAARYFYCAKASKSERDSGLNEMPEHKCGMMEDDNYPIKTGSGNLRDTKRRNHHPTVKPTALMQYLCRLVTPPGGIVLDPFMGSGSTGKAALLEDFKFIGIELEKEYAEIAKRRINVVQPLFAGECA